MCFLMLMCRCRGSPEYKRVPQRMGNFVLYLIAWPGGLLHLVMRFSFKSRKKRKIFTSSMINNKTKSLHNVTCGSINDNIAFGAEIQGGKKTEYMWQRALAGVFEG